jgi:hypothetical protein
VASITTSNWLSYLTWTFVGRVIEVGNRTLLQVRGGALPPSRRALTDPGRLCRKSTLILCHTWCARGCTRSDRAHAGTRRAQNTAETLFSNLSGHWETERTKAKVTRAALRPGASPRPGPGKVGGGCRDASEQAERRQASLWRALGRSFIAYFIFIGALLRASAHARARQCRQGGNAPPQCRTRRASCCSRSS